MRSILTISHMAYRKYSHREAVSRYNIAWIDTFRYQWRELKHKGGQRQVHDACIYCMLPKSSLYVKLCMLSGKHQSVSQHKILLSRKVLNAVETCWKNWSWHFEAWLCLTNVAKLSWREIETGFRVIFWTGKAQFCMIPNIQCNTVWCIENDNSDTADDSYVYVRTCIDMMSSYVTTPYFSMLIIHLFTLFHAITNCQINCF